MPIKPKLSSSQSRVVGWIRRYGEVCFQNSGGHFGPLIMAEGVPPYIVSPKIDIIKNNLIDKGIIKLSDKRAANGDEVYILSESER